MWDFFPLSNIVSNVLCHAQMILKLWFSAGHFCVSHWISVSNLGESRTLWTSSVDEWFNFFTKRNDMRQNPLTMEDSSCCLTGEATAHPTTLPTENPALRCLITHAPWPDTLPLQCTALWWATWRWSNVHLFACEFVFVNLMTPIFGPASVVWRFWLFLWNFVSLLGAHLCKCRSLWCLCDHRTTGRNVVCELPCYSDVGFDILAWNIMNLADGAENWFRLIFWCLLANPGNMLKHIAFSSTILGRGKRRLGFPGLKPTIVAVNMFWLHSVYVLAWWDSHWFLWCQFVSRKLIPVSQDTLKHSVTFRQLVTWAVGVLLPRLGGTKKCRS